MTLSFKENWGWNYKFGRLVKTWGWKKSLKVWVRVKIVCPDKQCLEDEKKNKGCGRVAAGMVGERQERMVVFSCPLFESPVTSDSFSIGRYHTYAFSSFISIWALYYLLSRVFPEAPTWTIPLSLRRYSVEHHSSDHLVLQIWVVILRSLSYWKRRVTLHLFCTLLGALHIVKVQKLCLYW